MTHELMQRELVIDLTSGNYQVNPIADPRIIGPVDYGWVKFCEAAHETGRDDPDVLTWGGGPLAGSRILGTRRLFSAATHPNGKGFTSPAWAVGLT